MTKNVPVDTVSCRHMYVSCRSPERRPGEKLNKPFSSWKIFRFRFFLLLLKRRSYCTERRGVHRLRRDKHLLFFSVVVHPPCSLKVADGSRYVI